MSHWDNMDKKVWSKSEVMNEFEQILIKAMDDLNKKVEAQQQTQEISRKLDDINKGVESTSKNLSSFLEQAKNLAQDDGEDLGYIEEPILGPTPEEQALAKASLLEELNELAVKASNEGNYKLAYKIERSIDQIIFEG